MTESEEQSGRLFKSGRWAKPNPDNSQQGGSAATTTALKTHRSIKWDEETIAEHDRERGTRQKIDEPPTPYSYVDVNEPDNTFGDGNSADSSSSAVVPHCCVFNLNAHSNEAEKLEQIEKEQCKKSVSNRFVECNSNGELGGTAGPQVDSSSSSSYSSHALLPNNANVAANWTQLSAQLEYEAMKAIQQPTLIRDENNSVAHQDTARGKAREDVIISSIDASVMGFASALAEKQSAHLKEFVHENDGQTTTAGASATRHTNRERRSSSFGEDEEDQDQEQEHTAAFEQHRSKHYNEFKVVQAMKAKMAAKTKRRQERIASGLSTGDTDSSDEDVDDDI